MRLRGGDGELEEEVLELEEEEEGLISEILNDEGTEEVVKLLKRPEQREIALNVGDKESGL